MVAGHCLPGASRLKKSVSVSMGGTSLSYFTTFHKKKEHYVVVLSLVFVFLPRKDF